MSIDSKSEVSKVKVEVRDVPVTSPLSPIPSRHRNDTHISTLSERLAVTYFEGPHDIQKHSKLPMFMRLEGGILPKMLLPLLFVGCWSTAIVLINKYVADIGVDTVLPIVLGFVVAFAVSFRASTAYERYSEGRRYWSQLILTSRNLGRHVWINMAERDDEEDPDRRKKDLLGKITAMNLIVAFSIALKHRLRFEPAIDYPDFENLIAPIINTTMVGKADQSRLQARKRSTGKRIAEYLGLSFAMSNPRKLLKRSEDNLGNLPHEILLHLSAYLEKAMATKQIHGPNKFFWNDIRTMSEILTGVERILNTPLPLAYTISLAQITWVYIMVLPFQLIKKLSWATVPATMLAAYIILGLAMIGHEIEDPFGNDVNDLPLDQYCHEIRDDLDVIMSHTLEEYGAFEEANNNRPLFPLNCNSTTEWLTHDMTEVRALLRTKAADTHTRKRRAMVKEEV